jgi:regulator of protease activity HflC (stomatin/prohibitin superfamily)
MGKSAHLSDLCHQRIEVTRAGEKIILILDSNDTSVLRMAQHISSENRRTDLLPSLNGLQQRAIADAMRQCFASIKENQAAEELAKRRQILESF